MFLTNHIHTIITTLEDPSNTKRSSKEDSKVIVNIPKRLLEQFDMICEAKYYSRVEGIKQALHEFITNSMPEDRLLSSVQKMVENQTRSAFFRLAQEFTVANDSKYKTLQQQTHTLPIAVSSNRYNDTNKKIDNKFKYHKFISC